MNDTPSTYYAHTHILHTYYMYRASHRGTIIVVDDTPSIGDVARAMRAAVRARLLLEVLRDALKASCIRS
jgi:hypothetical protein